MKNLEKVSVNDIDAYIYSIWATDTFKELHLNNDFFKFLVSQLKKAPLWFYEESFKQQRYHLTSFFRFICHRSYYDNKYIQDLYYLHELIHCAQYAADKSLCFQKWKLKLSENELIASLFSECFIYFIEPTINHKTFPDLWVHQSFKEPLKYTGPLENWFEVSQWPKEFQLLLNERLTLREIKAETVNLHTEAEKLIISYNHKHHQWLGKWESSFYILESNLEELLRDHSLCKNFENFILSSVDKFDRPFGEEVFK